MPTLVNTVAATLSENDHPYMNGAWTPNFDEYDADDMEVIGEIPRQLSGAYMRNGSNQQFEPRGPYHLFDGDGMIHAFTFDDFELRDYHPDPHIKAEVSV